MGRPVGGGAADKILGLLHERGGVIDCSTGATGMLITELELTHSAASQALAKLQHDGRISTLKRGGTIIRIIAASRPQQDCDFCKAGGEACALHRVVVPPQRKQRPDIELLDPPLPPLELPPVIAAPSADDLRTALLTAAATIIREAADEHDEFVMLQGSYCSLVDELADHKQRLKDAHEEIGRLKRANELLGQRVARSA